MTGIPSNKPRRGPQGPFAVIRNGVFSLLAVTAATGMTGCDGGDQKEDTTNMAEGDGPMEEETTEGMETDGSEDMETTAEDSTGEPLPDLPEGDTTTDDSGDTTTDGETGTDTTDGGTDTGNETSAFIENIQISENCWKSEFGDWHECLKGPNVKAEATFNILNGSNCSASVNRGSIVKDAQDNTCHNMGNGGWKAILDTENLEGFIDMEINFPNEGQDPETGKVTIKFELI